VSRFSNLGRDTPAQMPNAETMRKLDGSFQCQTCDDYVYQALWSPETKILGWKCAQGHLSKIEEFTL
jgi:hypothetical protein